MTENTKNTKIVDDSFIRLFKRLINLKADTDQLGSMELIKSNISFQSANAWTLVFAIFIASVGLNINSTAVIIGAMLISPLMGPIVGIGLALGTYDFILLKKSARNLSAAVLISIITSTIYFLLSPLSEVQSELLARTRPSFFDVLVAFFGGAAGIVAISRKEKGNVIPGVAIATALMPPLCTAGFGLATRNPMYFFGALYLFIINSVFISISTFIFVRYLGFHNASSVHSGHQRYLNRWIASVAVTVLIPSFFMAWYLQQESFFKSQANKYISAELRSDKFFVVKQDVSYRLKDSKIQVTVMGETLSDETIETLKQKAKTYSIEPSEIEIRQSSISENIERKIGEKISATEELSKQLQMKLSQKEAELEQYKSLLELSRKVTEEAVVIFPKLSQVILSPSGKIESPGELHIFIQWKNSPNVKEINTASNFFIKRLNISGQNITHARKL